MRITVATALFMVLVLGQGAETNWLEEAWSIGGSGSSPDGRYVRLIPSEAWGRGVTPDAWCEMRMSGRRAVVRGAIPALRDGVASVVLVLRAELPAGADLRTNDTYGAASPRVHVRFVADAVKSVLLAQCLRRAFERIQPGALGAVSGRGRVRKDAFECESLWTIITPQEERLVVSGLPAELQKDGQAVRFVGRRRPGGRNEFGYFGGAGHWFGRVKFDSVEGIAVLPPRRSSAYPDTSWSLRCEAHARDLLEEGRHRDARLTRPLSGGFEKITDPGFNLCPICQRALGKSWVYTDATHDQVEATLSSCARDRLYFLGRDGHHHGPFFPSQRKETRR